MHWQVFRETWISLFTVDGVWQDGYRKKNSMTDNK